MIPRLADQGGAVAILVAIMILPMAMLVAFAVDIGNWWTHQSHLQTQADAGALAGALGPWFPTCDETAIENAARQYSGNGGTGYNTQYTNKNNVTVLINSTNYSNNGGSDFSDTGKPCNTLASAGPGHPGFLDLKVNEANLSNFFGSIAGFSVVPAIHAHARVSILAVQQESGLRPLAFADTSLYKCAEVQLWSASSGGGTGSLLATVNLPTRTTLVNGNIQFQNPAGQSFTVPAGQNVAVSLLLGNTGCANTAAYPEGGGVGLNFINSYNPNGAPGTGATPRVHGVSLPLGSSSCLPDPYFTTSTGSCTSTVKAYVDFAPGAVTSGATQNAFVSINGSAATVGSDADGTYWTANIGVSPQSGQNPVSVTWTQKFGTVPNGKKTQTCTAAKPCTGDFSCSGAGVNGGSGDCVEQQAFASDSTTNPIGQFQIGELGLNTSGANSFAEGSTHNLVFTLQIKGLQNSKPTDPPYVMHTDDSQATGLVDCGQGNSDSGAANAMANGCPRPIYLYTDGTACVDTSNSKAPAPVDCVQSVPGKKSSNILDGISTRINGTCNNWNAYRDFGTAIPQNDPRLVDVIIVDPPIIQNGDMPVRTLAAFYITGVDGQSGVSSPSGCQNDLAGSHQILGHWVKWVPPGGTSGSGFCNPNVFGDCVAVLTQ